MVVFFIGPIFLKRKQLPPISFYSLISFKLSVFFLLIIALMTPSTTKISSNKVPHYIFGIDISQSIDREDLKNNLRKYLEDFSKVSSKLSYFYFENSPILKPFSDFDYRKIDLEKSKNYSSIYQSIYEIKDGLSENDLAIFILFTDGNETEVHNDILQTLTLDNIHLKMVASIAQNDNVQIKSISHPQQVLPEGLEKISVFVESKKSGSSELEVYKNGSFLKKESIELKEGANVIELTLESSKSGIDNYSLELKPSFSDTKKSNNFKYFHIKIDKPNKYLLIENKKSHLQGLLNELNIEFDWKKSNELSGLKLELYQAILINNVKKSEIPNSFEWKLVEAIGNGIGLATFGGMNFYGLGGYFGSEIERVSPVYMPPRSYKKTTLMCFIIDASGSMLTSRKSLWGSNNLLVQFLQTATDSQVPIRVAKKAAINAIENLMGIDVSVYSFNNTSKLIVPITSLDDSNIDSVKLLVSSIKAGGGTRFVPVLEEALSSVDMSQYKQANFFFLSDGAPADKDMISDTLTRLRSKNIKLYTLGFGDGVDEYLLKQMANETGGAYLRANDLSNLESIFEKAMSKVFGHPVVLQKLSMIFDENQTFIKAKDLKLQALNGMNMTRAKRGSKVLIQSDKGLPLLVQSQYGLGKTFAWMGDSGERWSQDMIKSGVFKAVIAPNLFLISRSNEIHFKLHHHHNGKQSSFVIRIFDEEGEFLSNLDLSAKIMTSNSATKYLSFFESEAGVYKASILSGEQKSFLMKVSYEYKGRNYSLERKISVPEQFETAFDGENIELRDRFRDRSKLIQKLGDFKKIFSLYRGEKRFFVIKHSIPFLLLAIFFYILDVIFRRFRIMDHMQEQGEGEDKWVALANHYLSLARKQIQDGNQNQAEHSYLSAQKYFKMSSSDQKAEEVWKEYRRNVS